MKKSISVPLTTTFPLDDPAGDDIAYVLPVNNRRPPLEYWNHWCTSSAGSGDPGSRLGEGSAPGAAEITAEVVGAGLDAAVPSLQETDRAAVTVTMNTRDPGLRSRSKTVTQRG